VKALQKILIILGFLVFITNSYSQVIKTIVIDAGHGGKDSGAVGKSGYYEKKVVLAVALKVGHYIEENMPNVKVIYTRNSDKFIELHERANIANKNNADLFISIHANSAKSSSAYGTESYVLGLHKTEENLNVAKRENSVIKYEEDTDKHYKIDLSSPDGFIRLNWLQLFKHSLEKEYKERIEACAKLVL